MERSDLRPLREMFDAITTARRPRERGTPRAALDAASPRVRRARDRGNQDHSHHIRGRDAQAAAGTHERPVTRDWRLTHEHPRRLRTSEHPRAGHRHPGSALRAAGAVRVFVDHATSSRRADRPQWLARLDYLRPGDTLLVWRLDRLAGTQTLAIETINDLHEREAVTKSLTGAGYRHHNADGPRTVRDRRGVRSAASTRSGRTPGQVWRVLVLERTGRRLLHGDDARSGT